MTKTETGPNPPAPLRTRRTNADLSLPHRPANGARRTAALRLPPLEPCGCVRDPDHDRHRCHGDMTLAEADAVIAAANYLESLGVAPLFDSRTLRAVWRLLPEHRSRLEDLARRGAA